MTAKRIAAFLAAAALIVAALLIRNGLSDDSSDSTDGTDKPSTGNVTVVCSTEFKVVCDDLPDRYQITVEPAGTTLDRLSLQDADVPDAWITLDPFPGMVDALRTPSGLTALAPNMTVVGSDAPLLAIPSGRVQQFDAGCASQPAWRCIGNAAGDSWSELADGAAGTVLPGLTDPATEANGLVSFANAVAGYFGGTDFSSNSFTDDPGFNGWMRNVGNEVKVVPPGKSPLSTLITRQTDVNVASTSVAQAGASPQQEKFSTVELAPAFQNLAVVAAFGSRANALAAELAPRLGAAGWVAAADPAPQLPAGTFIALRKLWRDS